jgi:hypothetical protein
MVNLFGIIIKYFLIKINFQDLRDADRQRIEMMDRLDTKL